MQRHRLVMVFNMLLPLLRVPARRIQWDLQTLVHHLMVHPGMILFPCVFVSHILNCECLSFIVEFLLKLFQLRKLL